MKNLFFIFLLTHLTFSTGKIDYIFIEYYGNNEKLLNPIYISEKPLPEAEQVVSPTSDFAYNELVNKHEFKAIEKMIMQSPKKIYAKSDIYGVKVSVRLGNRIDNYFLSFTDAKTFIKNIIALTHKNKGNSDLTEILEKYQWKLNN